MSERPIDFIAEKVRGALDAADLEQFSDLLDTNVTWGAPGDPTPACQSRRQVLAWYANGRTTGRRGHVHAVTTHGDKILLTMTVTSPGDTDSTRWQVLTARNGRITDIGGYDNEPNARAAAGLT